MFVINFLELNQLKKISDRKKQKKMIRKWGCWFNEIKRYKMKALTECIDLINNFENVGISSRPKIFLPPPVFERHYYTSRKQKFTSEKRY